MSDESRRLSAHSPAGIADFRSGDSLLITHYSLLNSGFTLAELLSVLAIMAVLAAMSLGVIASLPTKYSHEQAAGTVRALVRRARAAALESRAEASVVFSGKRLEARSWRSLGLWRFEDLGPDGLTHGARGMDARATKATQDEGWLGSALYFEQPGAFADCGNAPIFSPRDGVRVDAAVLAADFEKLRADDTAKARPPAPGKKPTDLWEFQVAGKGDEYWLRIREDYAILAHVSGERGLYVERATPPGAVPPERWTRVGFVYDGEEMKILVDGLRRDIDPKTSDPMPHRLVATAAPLEISSSRPGLAFAGGVDELAVSGMIAEEEAKLPDDLAIEAPPAIRFDSRGELDTRYHEGGARIVLSPIRGDGKKLEPATIEVERSGIVR